jgi:hypothetical protein
MTTPLQVLQALGINPAASTHQEYLDNWLKLKDTAKALSEMEIAMRKALFTATFPAPKEGANTFLLPDGRKLVATHKINRTIDETLVALARSEYDLCNDRPVEFDALLKTKVELVTSAYRKIEPATGEAPSAAFLAAARMITEKPGTPSMEVK